MDLLELNKRGIFPSPTESQSEFLKRAEKLSKKTIPLEVSKSLKEKFDINPDWVECSYTNRGLHFWEAACVEIKGDAYTLKLKKALETKERYLRVYSKKEILSHECLHLSRMAFKNSRFEECLAYQTSHPLRRLLGPLIQSQVEVIVLMLTFIISMSVDLLGEVLFFPNWLMKALPFLFLGVCALRLINNHRILKLCRNKLVERIKDPLKVSAVMLRLSDLEIVAIGKGALLSNYLEQHNDFRWQIIKRAYF